METEKVQVHLNPKTVRQIRLEGDTGTVIGQIGKATNGALKSFPWIAITSNGRIFGNETESGAEARLIESWSRDRVKNVRSFGS